MKKLLVLLVIATLGLSSCLTTKTSVGDYRASTEASYTYAKGKQLWLFWGLLPLGRTDVETPSSGSCMVITRYNFGDVLLSGLTGGLISSYTIKVKAKRTTETSTK